MEKLISVIVPVYNVEKYLSKCLDSLVSQTYRNIEILLINDGSTDNSLSICEDYGDSDKRIKIFSKNNSGVSSARNVGLENAKGDYITFVDSDDYVSERYCENLYNLIVDNDSDLVCTSRINVINDKFERVDGPSFLGLTSEEALTKYFLGDGINCYLFAKIFRAEIIKGLRFDDDLESAEDVLFIYQALLKILKVTVNNNIFDYYYVIREGSLTNKRLTSSRIESSIRVAEYISKNCKTSINLEILSKISEISLKGEILEWISVDGSLKNEFSCYYYTILKEIRCFPIFKYFKYFTLKKFVRIFLLKINPRIVTLVKNYKQN
jgi:glycosyltransferase involved in cell wall biosynthesis